MIKQRLDKLAEQKKEVSSPPTQSEPIVHSLETEDKQMSKLEDSANLNVVLKRQSKDNHSTTEAQLEVPMEPSSKKDSVSIVSDQVDSVSIVSDPVDQSSGNQSPKLKLKKSRQGRRETKWWSLWKRLKRRKMMILQVQQDSW